MSRWIRATAANPRSIAAWAAFGATPWTLMATCVPRRGWARRIGLPENGDMDRRVQVRGMPSLAVAPAGGLTADGQPTRRTGAIRT